jgi:hypothetical protein
MPRPAETTISASGNGTMPFLCLDGFHPNTPFANRSTRLLRRSPPPQRYPTTSGFTALPIREIIFTALEISNSAIDLPEKDRFF